MDTLTPVYRIEHFLDAIVNNTICSLEPHYRVEFYLAKLAGADVALPIPESRIDFYFAKLCGEDVAIPTPESRIDFYLAKLCGEEVDIPDPIYRVEQWLHEMASDIAWATFTGDIIQFNAPKAHELQSVVVDIEPQQDLSNGDPSPTNICPISGWTGAKVYRTGKNLFDESQYQHLMTGYEYELNGYRCLPIQLKANTQYTLSQNAGVAQNTPVLLINNVRNVNASGYFDCRLATHTRTFTTDETGKLYIGVLFNTSDEATYARIQACNIQIELGSTATTYEPYTGNTYTIDLNGTRYGGTLNVTTGVLTVTHGIKTFDGSENFSKIEADTGNRYSYAIGTNGGAGVCSHGTFINSWSGSFGYFRLTTSGAFGILDKDNEFANTTALQTYLAQQYSNGTPLQVTYLLATPITVQLTAQQISALVGTNTMWADTGDITAVARATAINLNGLQLMRTLLGGNYINNGTAEDISDEEAASIILGGTE